MKNISKTAIFTLLLSFVFMIFAFFIQLFSIGVLPKCSYLDPIFIDIFAFFGSLFLIIEGVHRIVEHRNSNLRTQITRSIRIALGCSILIVHVIQFVHK